MTPPLAIVLNGGIGVGKSTVGPAVAKALKACYVAEPVDKWRRSGKLQTYYDDPTQAHAFQSYVLNTRASALNACRAAWKAQHGEYPGIIVLDRWLDGDMMFAKVNHAMGNMTDDEFGAYQAEHADITKSFERTLNVKTIWLDASAEVCLERIRARGRGEETAVSIDYLRMLNDARIGGVSISTETLDSAGVADQVIRYVNQTWRASALVTVSRNGVIGRDGKRPWAGPEDLECYRRMTALKTVIMGRRTHDGLVGQASWLLGVRRTIIISRNPNHGITFDELLQLEPALDSHYVFVGGQQIYEEAFRRNLVGRVMYTTIDCDVADGDTFFALPAEFATERTVTHATMTHATMTPATMTSL